MQIGGRVVVSAFIVVVDLAVHASEGIANGGDGTIGLSAVRGFDFVVFGGKKAVGHRRRDAVLQKVRSTVGLSLLLCPRRGNRDCFAIWLLFLLTVGSYDLAGNIFEGWTAVDLWLGTSS